MEIRNKKGQFIKGLTPHNKGRGKWITCLICGKKRYVENNVLKNGNGKFCSKQCFDKYQTGKPSNRRYFYQTEKAKEKLRIFNLGKKHSEITKKKMSEMRSGSKHWNWQGGTIPNPYPKEFTSELKLKIRIRDNFTCCLCGRTEREELEELNRVLCVNHIDFDKKNCREENLNTLCLRCNIKINRERDYWTNYFNTIL
jgi:hypothetical protein